MAATVGKHRSRASSIRKLQVKKDIAKSKIEQKTLRIELYQENVK